MDWPYVYFLSILIFSRKVTNKYENFKIIRSFFYKKLAIVPFVY